MATVNYSWNLPTVGGSEDTWGTSLNANWTDLDTLLGGVSQTEFAILDGATVSTAELNILDGVTATTAEINQLDGNGFTADVLPDADSTRDLGSSTKAWAEAHVDTVISTNVSDGTLSIPTTYVTNGSAKAWVNFNGTGTIAIRDSLNVSSLTDNGTGDYTVNLSSAFGATDYATAATARRDAGGGAIAQKKTAGTVASVQVAAVGDGGSNIDVDEMSVTNFGDLA